MSAKPAPVKLVEIRGPTSIFIDAAVKDDDSVEVSGQDVGEAPAEMFGDSDYEYWLNVAPEHKDALVLALLEKLYLDDERTMSKLMALLDAKGIPYRFQTYA